MSFMDLINSPLRRLRPGTGTAMSQASQGGIPAGDKASAMAGQTWIHAIQGFSHQEKRWLSKRLSRRFPPNQSNDRYVSGEKWL